MAPAPVVGERYFHDKQKRDGKSGREGEKRSRILSEATPANIVNGGSEGMGM